MTPYFPASAFKSATNLPTGEPELIESGNTAHFAMEINRQLSFVEVSRYYTPDTNVATAIQSEQASDRVKRPCSRQKG